MRVVVSGGSGLIGRALVAGLAADGHQTTVLSRSPGRLRDLPASRQPLGTPAASPS
ncbi:MAG: NAD-dependent epimerase/dehydratase family protein [Thermoanaerobaculia bacterium]